MSSTTESPNAPSPSTRMPTRAKNLSQAEGWKLLSRRRFFQVAAGGVAGGAVAGLLFRRPTPPIVPTPEVSIAVAPPRPVVAPALPMPMEEEPLPSDVREPVASSEVMLEDPPKPVLMPAPAPTAVRPVATPSAVAPAATVASNRPAWLRNALPLVPSGGKPAIAIVIDDLGLDRVHTRQAIALDGNVTLAFMTYADGLANWIGSARERRHEFLVHMPMQPLSPKIDPGPHALTVDLSQAEILDRLRWGLERMDGYIGVNNHMGSRFTESAEGMAVVLAELKSRGLLFLDSVTTGHSACAPTAASLGGIPFAERNVFLDNEATAVGVTKQLAALEAVARKHGAAIAIGHPHETTLSTLAEWLPSAAQRGVTLVPLTSLMRRAA
jgi:uncharacterized protein